MSETAVTNTTLKFLAPGEFNIISDGKTLHTAGHDNGNGTSGNIIHYDAGANSGSSWRIIEVEHPELATAKAGLQTRVDELNAVIANMGTAIGQYKSDDKEELLGYLATAQVVLDSGSSNPDDYTNALVGLNESISSLDYSVIHPEVGDKIVIKNRQHNTFLGVRLEGGNLDGTTALTAKQLWGYKTGDSGYENCWELVSTIYNEEACYYLYSPYYDWYASPIADRNTGIALAKTQAEAGCYQIEFRNGYFVFKCLNGADTGYSYLHQVDWTGSGLGWPVVDWGNGAAASHWSIELVSEDTESRWLDTVKAEAGSVRTFLEAREFGEGIGRYSGITSDEKDAALAALSGTVGETMSKKIKNVLYAIYDISEKKNSFSINNPAAGFYRIKSMNANDENKKGKYWQVNSDATAMELNATAHDFNSIVYLGADKTILSYGMGLYVNNYDDAPATVGTEPRDWTISENNAVVGTYTLYKRKDDGNVDGYCLSDWTGNATYGQNDGNAAWIFEEVTSLPVAVTAAKVSIEEEEKCISTFYAPVALDVPAGVIACTGQVVDNYLALTAIEGVGEEPAVIPANTGVILLANAANGSVTYDFSIHNGEVSGFSEEDNHIKGSVAKTLVAPEEGYNCYVLAKKNGNVGLYKASLNKNASNEAGTTHFINNACKAYIPKAANVSDEPAPEALAFRFGRGGNDEGTTDLEKSEIINHKSEMIFDLTGRRIEKIVEKGIYIVNGKKVVIR